MFQVSGWWRPALEGGTNGGNVAAVRARARAGAGASNCYSGMLQLETKLGLYLPCSGLMCLATACI